MSPVPITDLVGRIFERRPLSQGCFLMKICRFIPSSLVPLIFKRIEVYLLLELASLSFHRLEKGFLISFQGRKNLKLNRPSSSFELNRKQYWKLNLEKNNSRIPFHSSFISKIFHCEHISFPLPLHSQKFKFHARCINKCSTL